MTNTYSNPCVRCGSERIILKTWKEKMGESTIVNVETTCPNPECQEKVNVENKKQNDKYLSIKLRAQKRKEARKISVN